MKRKIIIALTAATTMFGGEIVAQTNDVQSRNAKAHEFRTVNGKVYDVTTSTQWVSITIPAGTGLLDQGKIHFMGTVQPIDVIFSIRTAHNGATTVLIHNFPYDPKYFYKRTPYTGIETKFPLNLRAFALYKPTTNWNALGEMKITPARPVFDYGLPCTNNVSEVQKTEAQP